MLYPHLFMLNVLAYLFTKMSENSNPNKKEELNKKEHVILIYIIFRWAKNNVMLFVNSVNLTQISVLPKVRKKNIFKKDPRIDFKQFCLMMIRRRV